MAGIGAGSPPAGTGLAVDLVVVVVGVVVGGAAVGLNLLGEKLRRPGVLLRPKGRDLKRKKVGKSQLDAS